MMSRNDNKPTKKANSKTPIRVVLRCASFAGGARGGGGRLDVPSTPSDPVRGSTTLLEIVRRLESLLPSHLFHAADGSGGGAASLVCLRKVVPQSEWANTTLFQILDGDDGSAGVVLTLDLGSASYGSVSGSNVSGGGVRSAIGNAIASAASSLNIKAVTMTSPLPDPEPMDVSNTDSTPRPPTPEQAISHILQNNFDAATKDCLLTLLKIIDNLLSKPTDPKVRSIRCANAAFEKKVGPCKGGIEFLYSVGFVGRFPAFGDQNEPEMLELPPQNESKEVLLVARKVLIRSATVDLNMGEEDLPPMPTIPDSIPASALRAPPSSAASFEASSSFGEASSSSGFNVYKTHSYNVQSAAVGAPDPYNDASSGMSATERQLKQLQSKKSKLEKEMQKKVEVDRGLVAYRAGSGPSGVGVGSSGGSHSGGGDGKEGKGDSSLLAAKMKKMEEERKKREEGGFTTKAMRDLEKIKKAKVYSHAQIRINFPDGTHLHGKFLPSEKVSSIRTVLESSFHPTQQSLDFDLYIAPPRRLLSDEKTLEEEELVPAAKIHVSWKVGGSPSSDNFLKEELFAAGKSSSSSSPSALFPDAKPVVEEKKPAAESSSAVSGGNNGNNSDKKPGQSKEDLLMQRMLGKTSGLLGRGNDGGSNKKNKDGNKKDGKPRWFKG